MLMKLLPPLSSGADPGISKPGARCRRGRIFRGLWIVFVVSVENKKHIVKQNILANHVNVLHLRRLLSPMFVSKFS